MKKRKRQKVNLALEGVPSDSMINTAFHETQIHDYNSQILKQAEDRIEMSAAYYEDIYRTARKDVSFIYGDQWERDVRDKRKNRPNLTMNLLPQYLNQVLGMAKKSKFSINVQQTSGRNEILKDDENNDHNYSKTQVMEGLFKDIEDRSGAHNAYCNAFKQALEGGFAFLWVKTVSNYDDPFNAEMRIEHIRDRWSVYMDPLSTMDDFSDARFCAKTTEVEVSAFEKRWPHVPVVDYKAHSGRMREISGSGKYWKGSNEVVQVMDYYWKEPMKRTALILELPDEESSERISVYKDEVEHVLDELLDEGFEITREEVVESHKIRYMRCTRYHILDGPYDWPSQFLPIIPVLGRTVDLPDKTHWVGMFRYAHDAQRMYNYWVSSATEKISLSPKAPFILPASQIAGYEKEWQSMNQTNRPYQVFNDDTNPTPPARSSTVAMATGELDMLRSTRTMVEDVVGLHDASLGKRTNEVSGVAIAGRQEQGETGTYDFVDSLMKSITRVGKVCLDMVPRVYANSYARRLILPDDSQVMINLNLTITDKQTGRKFRINSLDYSRFSCRISVGSNTATQRERFVTMMMEWGRSDPEGFQQLRHFVIQNMDIPNARALADMMKKTIPYHLLSEEDKKHMEPPEPGPEEKIAQMQSEAEMAKAEADVQKAELSVEQQKLRLQSDQVRLHFEERKGEDRTDERMDKRIDDKNEGAGEKGVDSDAKMVKTIEKVAKQVIAEAFAKMENKKG